MAIASPDLSWTDANLCLGEILGQPPDELLGQRWRTLTHPQDLQQELDELARLSAGERDAFSLQKRFVRSDGRVVHTASSTRCVRDEDGALERFVTVIEDISAQKRVEQELRLRRDNLDQLVEQRTIELAGTNQRLLLENQERKRIEQVLRASEAQKAAILDGLAEMVAYYRDPSLRVVWSNRAALSAADLSNGDATGRFCYRIWRQADDPCEDCPVLRAFASGQTEELETNTQDGRHWLIKATPVHDEEGSVLGVVEVGLDVTLRMRAEEKRRKLEKQVQQARRLESLGVLAGGIAHDFNNLLMGILGNANLALEELDEASPARENLLEIEQAASRAAEVSRKMLAYSGRGHFTKKPLNLNVLIEDALQPLRLSISACVVLQSDLQRDLPRIEADVSQILQVVSNLVANAAEAIGERSGVISITTKVKDCDREHLADTLTHENLEAGRYVLLEVSDTGCGMAPEVRQRIFDPFFTTKFTGRGLGLAALLGIVRGHKGAVKVDSQLGDGTSVQVLLPTKERTTQRRQSGEHPSKGNPLPRPLLSEAFQALSKR